MHNTTSTISSHLGMLHPKKKKVEHSQNIHYTVFNTYLPLPHLKSKQAPFCPSLDN